jgi:hypothetical protein
VSGEVERLVALKLKANPLLDAWDTEIEARSVRTFVGANVSRRRLEP